MTENALVASLQTREDTRTDLDGKNWQVVSGKKKTPFTGHHSYSSAFI